jgi:hypothetical protein
MSGLTLRRSTPATAGAGATAGLSRYATVDLLPPSVRERRALQALRGRLGVGIVLVVLVIALGYVAAIVDAAHASSLADGAEDERVELQATVARYSEAAQVRSAIESVTAAVGTVMSPEVLWADQVRAVEAALPDDAELTAFAVSSADPTAEASTPFVQTGTVGGATFMVSTPTLPDMAALLDQLEMVPGIGQVMFDASQQLGEDGGYSTSGRLSFDSGALSGRYTGTAAPEEAP